VSCFACRLERLVSQADGQIIRANAATQLERANQPDYIQQYYKATEHLQRQNARHKGTLARGATAPTILNLGTRGKTSG
jgi:hypothetical protein